MNDTQVASLETTMHSIQDQQKILRNVFHQLTTDGGGCLYDLKTAVGQGSPLGQTISQVGGTVMEASENVLKALSEFIMQLNDTITNAKATLAEASSAETEAVSGVDTDIDFSW